LGVGCGGGVLKATGVNLLILTKQRWDFQCGRYWPPGPGQKVLDLVGDRFQRRTQETETGAGSFMEQKGKQGWWSGSSGRAPA
jgi:hypothetical protein